MADVEKLIEHFDHHSPELAENCWPVYRALRERCPVAHSDAYGGFWVVSRYEDVAEIARDDYTFSSADGILIPGGNAGNIPIEMDPPEFQKYRRLLNPIFSPMKAKRVEPEIRAIATALIDAFIEDGHCDIHHALNRPLPAILTFRLLGFPTDEDLWRPLLDRFEYGVEEIRDPAAGGGRVGRLFSDVTEEVIQARRRQPQDDWISYLLAQEVEGRPLTDEELHGIVRLILAGGLLTTTDAIGNALIYMERDRDVRRRLLEEPAIWDTAIEEFLRYEASTTMLRRTVTKECVVGGQQLEPGEKVMIIWASANRDEAEFPNPEQYVIDRHPNRHVTFGVGAHRCLGSNLARSEFRVALEEVLRRMPDYRIDLDEVVPSKNIAPTYGRMSIPMTFTPGRRESTRARA